MGWDSYHTFNTPKYECDHHIDEERFEILRSCMKGTTYYAAIKNKATGEVFAAVCLTSYSPKSRSDNFAIKTMDETYGPYQYNCPETILTLLTPTDNKFAIAWRERCWANIERRKKLASVKVGQSIRFKSAYDLKDGTRKGDEIVLDKFKYSRRTSKSFWLYQGVYRFPNRLIPDEFEVID